MKLIEINLERIIALCKKHKVNKLFAFGSVLTDKFNDNSDIDLLVDFNSQEIEDPFVNFFDFKYSLQDILGRDVDLVDNSAVKNSFFRKELDQTKNLIYG
jgi:predicted nucleotidyltransferase